MIAFLEFLFYALVFTACLASIGTFLLVLGIARVMLRAAPAEAPVGKKAAPKPATPSGQNAPGDPTLRPTGTGLLDLQADQISYSLPAPETPEEGRKNGLRDTR